MKAVRFAKSLDPLMVPIGTVQQHPDNPNNGDLDALIESIKVNGFNTAITVDSTTGYILAGNHRWQALHALGADQIPVIWVENPPDGGRRYLVADNQTGKLAVMDDAMLVDILQDLQQTDQGLIGTGFDDEKLNQMLMDLAGDAQMPMGAGLGVAPNGIYQVVVEFEDEDDRNDLFATLADQYENKVRTVDL